MEVRIIFVNLNKNEGKRMFDVDLKIIVKSVMKDADSLKKDKTNVASITDRKTKQLYYVLTEEQFDLMFRKIKRKSNSK